MNFELSDDQRMLVETAANFVKRESPIRRMRALRGDDLGFSRETLKKMGEMGWLSLSLPEALGGLGLGVVDAALLLEQLGGGLVPEPYVASAMLGSHLLADCAPPAIARAQIEKLAAGEATLAVAYLESDTRYEISSPTTSATKTSDGWSLMGEKVFVENGHAADHWLVTARVDGAGAGAEALGLFLVARGAAKVSQRTFPTIDGRRAAALGFDGTLVPASGYLGSGTRIADALDRALDLAAAAACAEGVGLMRAVLNMTVEYLNVREQFGVKIGSFQALQHRAVDMFVEVESMKSAAIMAAIQCDSGDADERRGAVSAAKALLGSSGKFVVQQAIQLHGGIGITDEHDVGLYFKRMHALLVAYGDEEHHVARYASLPGFAAGASG